MLREELKDLDIPHQMYLWEYIMKTWADHLDKLQSMCHGFFLWVTNQHFYLLGYLGEISLMADVWSDPNLVPYMAVTSHWIEVKTIETNEGPHFVLCFHAEFIAFHHIERSS